jgi:hypothetical protein
MTFKQYLKENDLFDSMFDKDADEILARIKKRGKVVKSQPHSEPYTLTLFHGSSVDLESLRVGDNFVLNPSKSEQGLLWFTHPFIRGYDPIEYAKGQGDWVMKYPLHTKKLSTDIHYEDGTVVSRAPEEILNKLDPTKNSRFMCLSDSCIELPEGWYFTYKNEKFIGTNKKVSFSKDMIL